MVRKIKFSKLVMAGVVGLGLTGSVTDVQASKASRDIGAAIHTAKRALNLTHQYSFRAATYSLRTSKIKLKPYQYDHKVGEALDIIDLVLEKYSDPYLYASEKYSIGVDCITALITSLKQSKLFRSGHQSPKVLLNKAFHLLKKAKQAANYGNLFQAKKLSKKALKKIIKSGKAGNLKVSQAVDALEKGLDALNDPGLSQGDKIDIAVDCLKHAIKFLKQSRFVNVGGGFGPPPPPPVEVGVQCIAQRKGRPNATVPGTVAEKKLVAIGSAMLACKIKYGKRKCIIKSCHPVYE